MDEKKSNELAFDRIVFLDNQISVRTPSTPEGGRNVRDEQPVGRNRGAGRGCKIRIQFKSEHGLKKGGKLKNGREGGGEKGGGGGGQKGRWRGWRRRGGRQGT